MHTLGTAALEIALKELGNGEEGSNNQGFHINKYRLGAKPRGHGAWCATFVSWCLEQGWAAMGNTSPCPVLRSNGAKQLANRCARYGEVVEGPPQRGDILLIKRPGGWHIAIATGTTPFAVELVDGNRGRFPAIVKPGELPLGHRNLRKVIRLP